MASANFLLPSLNSDLTLANERSLDVSNLKPGDAILYYPSRPELSQRAIHAYQSLCRFPYFHSFCTHIAIYLGDSLIVDATPAERVAVRQFSSSYVNQILRVRRLVGFSADEINMFVEKAKTLEGKKYDFFGVGVGVLGLRKYFSSIEKDIKDADGDNYEPVPSGAENLQAVYCSKIFEYCYTYVKKKGLSDLPLNPLFLPAMVSATGELEDIAVAWMEVENDRVIEATRISAIGTH